MSHATADVECGGQAPANEDAGLAEESPMAYVVLTTSDRAAAEANPTEADLGLARVVLTHGEAVFPVPLGVRLVDAIKTRLSSLPCRSTKPGASHGSPKLDSQRLKSPAVQTYLPIRA